MPELIPLLTENEIAQRVTELADRISNDYRDRRVVLVGILKGAFVFLADLIRKLSIPAEVDFIWISSYGMSDASSGDIKIRQDVTLDLEGKDVILVEDIIDSGITIQKILPRFKNLGAKSVKVCAFIDKLERRETDFTPDYTGYRVPRGFLVGYGLDYAEQYRYLPGIYEVKTTSTNEAQK